MAGIIVVFDFDKTIIDVDSDNWVIDELGFTDLFEKLLPTMPWNSLMDTMMKEIHSQGNSIDDIVEVLGRVPIHPRVVPTIKALHSLGCELRIVSDANMFFIEKILEHLGLKEFFTEINTNPGIVDSEGRVRIFPYHDFTKRHHGCNLCPPNMCKGLVMDRIQEEIKGNKRMIYLGDGSGDYCPSLRLKETDFLMPRKDFPLWNLIAKNPSLVKAETHEWSEGEDQEREIFQIVNSLIPEDSATVTLFSPDCKLQTIFAGAPNEGFPKVVPVRL